MSIPSSPIMADKVDNVLKVAYWLLIGKIKIAENQMINSYLWYPEQEHEY